MRTVLVVAPHPDDETLGCGGSLLRHIAHGDEVFWLIMTRITEDMGFTPQRVSSRHLEIEQVASKYSFKKVYRSGFDSMALDTYSKGELVSAVSAVVGETQANIIYTPYRLDAHSDHAAVFDAVASCVKSFRYPSVRSVRAYETLSETEFGMRPEDGGFRPNLFVNVTPYLDEKLRIMGLYEGEMAPHPFPRSERAIRSIATLRGATAGVEAAEAFMILREIHE